MSVAVLISAGEPEPGGWCDDCLLPSRIRVPIVMITAAGASDTAIPAAGICTECGRRY